MPAPPVALVPNLISYLTAVSNATAGTGHRLWYRGVGMSNSHHLRPGLYRDDGRQDVDELLKLERRMLVHFKRLSTLVDAPKGVEDIETLFYMQHHGVKTRLLDWSINPILGLYFALTSTEWDGVANTYREPAAVWVLDPSAWNHHAIPGFDVLGGIFGPADDAVVLRYAPRKSDAPMELASLLERPGAMNGVANSKRMIAQAGVFTIAGRIVQPMETIYDTAGFPAGCLSKLEIPLASIDVMKEELRLFGVTETAAYPDVHGVALEVNHEAGF